MKPALIVDARVLQFASEKLRDDRALVWCAVNRPDGSGYKSLDFMSRRLRDGEPEEQREGVGAGDSDRLGFGDRQIIRAALGIGLKDAHGANVQGRDYLIRIAHRHH